MRRDLQATELIYYLGKSEQKRSPAPQSEAVRRL